MQHKTVFEITRTQDYHMIREIEVLKRNNILLLGYTLIVNEMTDYDYSSKLAR